MTKERARKLLGSENMMLGSENMILVKRGKRHEILFLPRIWRMASSHRQMILTILVLLHLVHVCDLRLCLASSAEAKDHWVRQAHLFALRLASLYQGLTARVSGPHRHLEWQL